MDELRNIIDFYKNLQRQGPGGEAETLRAAQMAGLENVSDIKIADIGCGTGASTMTLAKNFDAKITAVDFLHDFLDVLYERVMAAGLSKRITSLHASMEALPFKPFTYDVLWSEGAIYNMGFAAGIKAWYPFLKKGGMLVVSEITWLTSERPTEVEEYWHNNYPEIDLASTKLQQLEQAGYSPEGYFVLPNSSWIDNYYNPIEANFSAFLESHNYTAEAQALVAEQHKEMELYKKYQSYYGYGMYIARKI